MDGNGAVIWGLGKTILVFLFLACLGSIIFWLRVEKKGAIFELKCWPKEVSERLMVTYFHLVSSYLMNCISVAYVLCSPKLLDIMTDYPHYVILSKIILMSALTTVLEFIPYRPENNLVKNAAWALHSSALGLPIAYFGSHICTMSALSTVAVILLATLVAYSAPRDSYRFLGDHLAKLYFAVTVSSIISIVNSPPVTPFAIFIITVHFLGGILLYFGVFVVNLQFLFDDAEVSRNFDPIYSAAVIYLCTINLYVRIAMYYVVQTTSLTDSRAYCGQITTQVI